MHRVTDPGGRISRCGPGLMVELLSEHLKHHVAAPEALGARERAVDDISAILKTYLK